MRPGGPMDVKPVVLGTRDAQREVVVAVVVATNQDFPALGCRQAARLQASRRGSEFFFGAWLRLRGQRPRTATGNDPAQPRWNQSCRGFQLPVELGLVRCQIAGLQGLQPRNRCVESIKLLLRLCQARWDLLQGAFRPRRSLEIRRSVRLSAG